MEMVTQALRKAPFSSKGSTYMHRATFRIEDYVHPLRERRLQSFSTSRKGTGRLLHQRSKQFFYFFQFATHCRFLS